ncbi:hypothetical protein [Pyrobaculum neutrophilum]|uniref:Uncharacterized protein n=1 Tax=Pyrobaculum neutrophilum (strain DSM 2338 / JCM 9278 / NBRC 100436 / V24Sta) TaxID=444157 RepID=B1YAU4_PYRNV|nr:hypothetical protein [Pyrobaculum neutrophilum]ACB39173.1 conserved hypothetical protein [Pyrobaculum neutrophilum V24Sta]
MEELTRLRYMWAHLTFRNKPVIKKARREEGDPLEEVLKLCPRPYRMLCYMAMKELKLSLSAVAEAGRDIPTAAALALEDATSGRPDLPRLRRYLATGDPGPDVREVIDKWRRAARQMY